MWLMTQYGFFSVVQHKDDADLFLVRARVRNDLQNLLNLCGLTREIAVTPDADYRYRLLLAREEWEFVARSLAQTVDYPNFKNRVHELPDQNTKNRAYMEVWSTLASVKEPAQSALESEANARRPSRSPLLAESGTDIQTIFQQAQNHLHNGEVEQALALFDFLIENAPPVAGPYFFKGLIHHQQGEHEAAINAFKVGLQIEPSDPQALRLMAISCLHAGYCEAAIRTLRHLLEVTPDAFEARILLGFAFALEHDFALPCSLSEWLEIHDPTTLALDDAPTIYLLGLHFVHEGLLDGVGDLLNTLQEKDAEWAHWLQKAILWAQHEGTDGEISADGEFNWEAANAPLREALSRFAQAEGVGLNTGELREIVAHTLMNSYLSVSSDKLPDSASGDHEFSLQISPMELIEGRNGLAAFSSREAARRFIPPDLASSPQGGKIVFPGESLIPLLFQLEEAMAPSPLHALVIDPAGPHPCVLTLESLRGLVNEKPSEAPPTAEKGPRTLPLLEQRGHLKPGDQLHLVKLPRKDLVLPAAARQAIYLGNGKARWNYDGQEASLSKLCQEIMRVFGGVASPSPYAGPDYWALSGGTVSLSQLAKQGSTADK
ncbi:MAG: tetratricopeptide repeat protein [Armatimonadota bacterium]|nr:tetratricopeptide repeat protein [Armatimonadota bacterium]